MQYYTHHGPEKLPGHDFASQVFLYMFEIVEAVGEVVRKHFDVVGYMCVYSEAPH